jgi:hypothetical protein
MPLRATAIALAATPVIALAISAGADNTVTDQDAGTDASMVEYGIEED